MNIEDNRKKPVKRLAMLGDIIKHKDSVNIICTKLMHDGNNIYSTSGYQLVNLTNMTVTAITGRNPQEILDYLDNKEDSYELIPHDRCKLVIE